MWDQLIFNSNDGGQNLLCVADFYLNPRHEAAQVKHTLYEVALTSAFLKIEQPVNVIVLEKPWGTHYRLKAPHRPAPAVSFYHRFNHTRQSGPDQVGGGFCNHVRYPGGTAINVIITNI